jgi:hypothetical protein
MTRDRANNRMRFRRTETFPEHSTGVPIAPETLRHVNRIEGFDELRCARIFRGFANCAFHERQGLYCLSRILYTLNDLRNARDRGAA